MMNNLGLYLHIPFCNSKCPYCDFYSFRGGESEKERYTEALCNRISKSREALHIESNRKADTLYIGGGTPSALGSKRLVKIIDTARREYLTTDAEITVECNPHGIDGDFFKALYSAGANRISLGLQSAVTAERRILGRLSDIETVNNAVRQAQSAGFSNISLDIMLGIPNQTEESLKDTVDFCLQTGVPHISGYILKLEEGTPLYRNQHKYSFPDEDLTADLYLQLCGSLNSAGIFQYEISNFAKAGFESRHNLKYWSCEEYLGLGPSAHSFINGKRFYFERDIQSFLDNTPPLPDGDGGSFEEYAMLSLRLTKGLQSRAVRERFGFDIPKEMLKKAETLSQNGLVIRDENGIRLTEKGFLLSNSVLAELL